MAMDAISITDPGWHRGSAVNVLPYTWALIPGLFADAVLRMLILTFPEEGYIWAGDGSPDFRFRYRPLVRKGAVHSSVGGLHEIWRRLAGVLRSDAYLTAVCDLVSVARRPDWTVDAGLCVYSAGCALKPHTDRPMRFLTQVTYLSERWEPTWGGALRVLRSDRIDDVAAEVLPVPNRSVVFVRSPASWHAVMPVSQGSQERRSLLLHLTT